MWLPSSRVEMAYIGPIVRNEVFFFTVILGAAALLVLREWMAARAQGRCECCRCRRTPAPGVGTPQTASLGLCFGVYMHGGHPDSRRGIRLYAGDGDDRSALDPGGRQRRSRSSFRGERLEPAHLQRRCERNERPVSCDSQTKRELGHGAGRLLDLRHGGLPAGRFERRLPQLRLRDLRPDHRASGWVQSDRCAFSRGKWRAGDRRCVARASKKPGHSLARNSKVCFFESSAIRLPGSRAARC